MTTIPFAPLTNPAPAGGSSAESGKKSARTGETGEVTNDHCANLSLLLVDESATMEFAQQLAAQLQPGMVIYLRGDLGAGKTTLVRGVLNALGYAGRVKSPTYTLLEPYQVAGLDLRHFDLYRMNDEAEWESAGFRDEFDGHNIFFVEWPENARNLLPHADIEIKFEIIPQGRHVEALGHTMMGNACLKQL